MKKVSCVGAATVDIVAIIPNEDIEKISFSNDSLSFLMLEREGKLELSSGDMHFGGDAFNSTLATLWLSGTPIETAAHCASKNAASVVCALDAHTNLLCYDELL